MLLSHGSLALQLSFLWSSILQTPARMAFPDSKLVFSTQGFTWLHLEAPHPPLPSCQEALLRQQAGIVIGLPYSPFVMNHSSLCLNSEFKHYENYCFIYRVYFIKIISGWRVNLITITYFWQKLKFLNSVYFEN